MPTTNLDFPPFADVSKGFEKVVSTADGKGSLYNVWVNKKTNQMLAELPRGYTSQKHFFAMTVSKGEEWAGLQYRDMYLYWKRYDKRMALVAPELGTLSSGDQESKSAGQPSLHRPGSSPTFRSCAWARRVSP